MGVTCADETSSAKTDWFVEGRNCWRVCHAQRVGLLVDAAAYFDALANALEQAQRSVLILGWDIDSRLQLEGTEATGQRLELVALLSDLAARRPQLHIHILCWDFAMVFAWERELLPVFNLGWRSHRRVHFQWDDQHPVGASHHQKVVVVDDAVAFVGGLDLTQARWDTRAHRPGDSRRRRPNGEYYGPFHDIQAMVDGEAAVALGDLARSRWERATGKRLARPRQGVADPWPPGLEPDLRDVEVALSRTLPAYRGHPEVREVEVLYQDAIAAASTSIYLENQYFTSPLIGKALAERLQEQAGPEVVLVMPYECPGWLEETTMGLLRGRLINYLRDADRFDRFRVYYPCVEGEHGTETVNVHAKVMVVDDQLLRIGSANLSNRSMGLDTECDLAVAAAGRSEVAHAIRGFRDGLLAEHMGVRPDEIRALVDAGQPLRQVTTALQGEGRRLVSLEVPPTDSAELLARGVEIVDPERPISAEDIMASFLPEDVRYAGPRPMLRLMSMLAIVAVLLVAWRWTPLQQYVTPETLSQGFNLLAEQPLAVLWVVGLYVVGGLLLVPVTLLIVTTAVVFEPVWAFTYGLLGSVASAVVSFGVGRLLGRQAVRRFTGQRINRLSQWLSRRGVLTVAAARLLPLAPFTIVNIVAGATRLSWRDYVWGTALGMAPGILAITVLGDRLVAVWRQPSVEQVGVLAMVAALAGVAIWALRRWLKARAGPPPGLSDDQHRREG